MSSSFEDRILQLYAAGHRDFREQTGVYQPSFSGAVLSDADFSGLNLERASFRAADLNRSNLRGATLDLAQLNAAKLVSADLAGIHAFGADFGGANLRSANLSGAWLLNARFGGVNLAGADLRGTTIAITGQRRSQRWLCDNCLEMREVHQEEPGEKASFRGAFYDTDTLWPDGFDPVAEGAVLILPQP